MPYQNLISGTTYSVVISGDRTDSYGYPKSKRKENKKKEGEEREYDIDVFDVFEILGFPN